MLDRKGKQQRIRKPQEKKVSSRQIKIANSNSSESKEEKHLLYWGWVGNVSNEINDKTSQGIGTQASFSGLQGEARKTTEAAVSIQTPKNWLFTATGKKYIPLQFYNLVSLLPKDQGH